MYSNYSFAAFFAILAVANAGILVAPSTKIIQGPSSRSTVIGSDGSAISSVAPAGQIIHEESVGAVAETAPVIAAAPAALALSAPVVAHSAVAYSAPWVSGAPIVSAYSAPLVSGVVGHNALDTVISGPSGTIATGRTLASPVVAAAPIVSAW